MWTTGLTVIFQYIGFFCSDFVYHDPLRQPFMTGYVTGLSGTTTATSGARDRVDRASSRGRTE